MRRIDDIDKDLKNASSISEETKTTELCLKWQGKTANPLDSGSPSGELARMIIKKRSRTTEFKALADNNNQLIITL